MAMPHAPDDVDALLLRLFEAPAARWQELLGGLCDERPEHARELRRRYDLLAATGLDRDAAAATCKDVPERLGDFRLLRPIGAGGMGMVFAAEQVSLGREVALKIVRPELVYSPLARQRFRREIEAVAQLAHPAIVPVLTHGQHGEVPYFVMPLVHACSCDEVISRLRGRAPRALSGADLQRAIQGNDAASPDPSGVFAGAWWQACVRLLRQVALGLDHAHRRGVVHRDLKPSNILLAPDGRALVVDFGLAHTRDDVRITRTGATPGSPVYMAPEQVRGLAVDERTDVYSLATTLRHLLSLSSPFPTDDSEMLRARILTGRAEPVANGAMPRDLAIVLQAAMDVDPARRYTSMRAFAADLLAVLEHRAIQARPLPRALRLLRWTQRHPTASTALLLGALLLLGTPTIVAAGIAGERDRARAAENVASHRAYEASIAAAAAALRAGDGAEAARHLGACPDDLRGFEWRHLRASVSGSLRTFTGHASAVTAIALAGDASRMASGDGDGRLLLWSPLQHERATPIALPTAHAIERLLLSADAHELAVVQKDPARGTSITVVDTASGSIVARRDGSAREVVCACDRGDSLLVCEDFTATELDAFTLVARRTVQLAPIGAPPTAGLASDGATLFSAKSATVQAWSLADGSGEILHDVPTGLVPHAAAAAGRAALAGTRGLFVVERSPLRLRRVDTDRRPCEYVAFDAAGELLFGIGTDNSLRTWDARSEQLVAETSGAGSRGRAFAVGSRRLLVAVGDTAGRIDLFGALGGRERQRLIGHSGIVGELEVTPAGELLSASYEPAIRRWDPRSGEALDATQSTEHWVTAMVIGSSGRCAFVAYRDRVQRVALPGLAVEATTRLGSTIVHLVAMPDDRVLAITRDRMFDVAGATATPIAALERPATATAGNGTIAFLAACGRVERWALASPPSLLGSFAATSIQALACTADGDTLFAAEGAMLRRRDARTGDVLWERRCANEVTSLLLLPDAQRLAAGNKAGAVILYDPADGRDCLVMQATSSRIHALAAPPRCDWLAASGDNGALTMFHAGFGDDDFAARLARADITAATWLDDRLRRDLALQPRVLAAIDAADLAPELRRAMLAAERLRPVMTWECAAQHLALSLLPDQSPATYERALAVAASLDPAHDGWGLRGLTIAYSSLRLGRFEQALLASEPPRACSDAIARDMARAARAMAFEALHRHDEARAELAALERDTSGHAEPDLVPLLAEARRRVAR